MIVLDTNVLSALMRAQPDTDVLDWLNDQPSQSIWITGITVFESRLGLGLLPLGKRRRELEASFEALLQQELQNRVLPFDHAAAVEAAVIAATRQRAGRPVDIRDTQIAGIVVARRATFVTRNLRHFTDLPTPVINPWDEA